MSKKQYFVIKKGTSFYETARYKEGVGLISTWCLSENDAKVFDDEDSATKLAKIIHGEVVPKN